MGVVRVTVSCLILSKVGTADQDVRDNTEGVQSFMEKRPVNFTGSVIADTPQTYPWWEPVQTTMRVMPAVPKTKL